MTTDWLAKDYSGLLDVRVCATRTYAGVSEAMKIWSGLVFCYLNCSDLLWEKSVQVIEKNLKFEAEGREFEKNLRSREQFIQTVKGQNNFW